MDDKRQQLERVDRGTLAVVALTRWYGSLVSVRGDPRIKWRATLLRDVRVEDAKMKIGSIVVRCYEFDRMLAFWQEALGYEPREPERGGWVVLRDPEGRGPNVSLDRVPQPGSPTPSARTLEPLGKTSRVHLDLYTTDQEGEVERLIGIGATRYRQEYRPNADFIVLEDPDGNRFCVIQVPDQS